MLKRRVFRGASTLVHGSTAIALATLDRDVGAINSLDLLWMDRDQQSDFYYYYCYWSPLSCSSTLFVNRVGVRGPLLLAVSDSGLAVHDE